MKYWRAIWLTILMVLPVQAIAAQVAERQIQGFNEAGTIFVFEQFGVQDGSGFPYSTIFQLSTVTSEPVFPLEKSLVRDETASLGLARRQARQSAVDFDGFLELGRHAFHKALGGSPSAVASARFSEHFLTLSGNGGRDYEVSLSQQVAPTSSCSGFTDGDEKTFEVNLKNLESSETKTLSPSGFPAAFYGLTCPTQYSIADVVLFRPSPTQETRIVVLVSTFSFGFEGPDRSFVAVMGTLH